MKIEKLCNFYASKYHLSIILLEYLRNKKLRKTKVVTFMQDNIEEEMKILNEKYKFNIDLTKDIKKAKEIYNEEINISKDMIFIVQGSLNYIEEVNEYISELCEDKANVKIINCYCFEYQEKFMEEIMMGSDKILFTTGEKAIS